MNQPSDAALPPTLPAGGEPGPVLTRRFALRLLAWSAASITIAAVVFGAYALRYPERMPAAVGDIVEGITGANPRPVHLMRPARAIKRGGIARQGDFLRPVIVGFGHAVLRVVPFARIRMGQITRFPFNSAART